MITRLEKPHTKEQLLRILTPTVSSWFFKKFKEFSIPQLYGVMEIHSRNNVLISAPTGATKTLTAFLSILNTLIDNAEKGILEDKIYAIYISPLKALNEDIKVNLVDPLTQMEEIAKKKLGIRVGVRTGDTTAYEKSGMLKRPPHILITTPESLAIVLASTKFIEHLRSVEWVIVDEIHALADNKRGVHLSLSLERLQLICPAMVRVGLSATISPLDEIAKYLVGYSGEDLRPCKIIDVRFLKEMDLKVLSPVPDLIDSTHAQMNEAMYSLIHSLIQEHKTTLIFTNTRAATERVVNHLKEKHPGAYGENIGAHHGSLSKTHRHMIEEKLRKGELKAIASSTSLELGIDIGSIDLVICLGSPKSVARFLQRAGRAGHQLHSMVKARIIVLDRDDLVECAVLLKSAIERKIDTIHIPTKALDVLSQQIMGMAIEREWKAHDLFLMIRQSYPYRNLEKREFIEIVEYLAGRYISLEDRHIYAKIWYDEESGMIGRKGKMSRVIHMTNIGTIPDESFVTVKVGEEVIGKIDEAFLERLKRGDVFVLGGDKYEFLYARGMTAQVRGSADRSPTIPSWVSEMLPLSFDLALEIGRFRKNMNDLFCAGKSKKEIREFIDSYLYVDENAAESIYRYFHEQFKFAEIPSNSRMVIEHYTGENRRRFTIFNSLYGRRVNDCLARALAYAISRTQHRDVEIGITDNGFYAATDQKVNVMAAFKLLKSEDLYKVLSNAIDQSEILRRRFRHCATRALMILRNYMGREKKVGRQQVSSMILINAVRRISPNFSILKEARREVLEDSMDVKNTLLVLKGIEGGKILVKEVQLPMPSPFAFNLVLSGSTDILKIEDKMEFLRRMHKRVLAQIGKEKE